MILVSSLTSLWHQKHGIWGVSTIFGERPLNVSLLHTGWTVLSQIRDATYISPAIQFCPTVANDSIWKYHHHVRLHPVLYDNEQYSKRIKRFLSTSLFFWKSKISKNEAALFFPIWKPFSSFVTASLHIQSIVWKVCFLNQVTIFFHTPSVVLFAYCNL